IACARYGSEIEECDNRTRIAKVSLIDIDALARIIPDDPPESLRIRIGLQRAFARINSVQVAHQPLQSRVRMFMQQVPGDLAVVIPLVPLPDFSAHEQQLLARL